MRGASYRRGRGSCRGGSQTRPFPVGDKGGAETRPYERSSVAIRLGGRVTVALPSPSFVVVTASSVPSRFTLRNVENLDAPVTVALAFDSFGFHISTSSPAPSRCTDVTTTSP